MLMNNQNVPQHELPSILIIDDTPANLKLLTDILSHGYRVSPASSGRLALKSLALTIPDIILLDIRMPEMDGFEVCHRLKSDELTREIPVIFISALDEIEDKVKGFHAGAVDYITKPFQSEEVIARVKAHLSIRQLQRQLKGQNVKLMEEIAERQQIQEELRTYQIHLEELVHERTLDLKKINEELSRSEEKYRSLVNNLNVGVYRNTLDYPGRWMWINPAFIRIFGYDSLEEFLNLQVIDIFFNPDDQRSLTRILSDDGFITNMEINLKKRDGSPIWVSITAQVYRNNDGIIEWVDGICEDITEKKQSEQEIKTAINRINKNMETLAILNDQIRNPLTVISCYIADIEDEIAEKIITQVSLIDEIVDKLDKGWIESEKVRNFLMKHYGIM
jgi:PAS domain S-box-containing protein